MTNDKKILFISDNLQIYTCLKKFIHSTRLKESFVFATSPQSYSRFRGKDIKCRSIDITGESNYLIAHFSMIISAHCLQIFPKQLVEKIRCVNIHPGLLPYNRGWYPQVFSIINKMPFGVTIHIMDQQIDRGEVLFQERIEIEEHHTSKDVYAMALEKEITLFKNKFEQILSPSCKSTPAEKGNINYKKDFENLKEINLEKETTCGEFIDYLRAMTHPPYKNCFFRDSKGKKVYVEIKLFR